MAQEGQASVNSSDAFLASAGTPSIDGFGGAGPEASNSERPEMLVGAAFVAGFLLAGLVRRLGR
jgi:hypothetical protein